MHNRLKTVTFLTTLALVLATVGYIIGSRFGAYIGLALGIAFINLAYWFSDKIILAGHQVVKVTSNTSSGLFEMVKYLSYRAGIPAPKIYIIPDHSPNAFATGRDPYHASIAVTQGLLGLLNEEELEGVIAHEMAHIKNRDTFLSSITALLVMFVMIPIRSSFWPSLFGGVYSRRKVPTDKSKNSIRLFLTAILSPLAAMIVKASVSGDSDFVADYQGARISGNPEKLANALRKMHTMSANISLNDGAAATAHLYTVNPSSKDGVLDYFSTHPSIDERVKKLLALDSFTEV